jgi:iron complex outermembrane receptor protein
MASTPVRADSRGAKGILVLWMTAALALAAPTAEAARQQDRAERLKRLSMEELLEIQVTSATKFPRRAAETPAAISVISQDDLRRSGVRTLADALRLATGVHVAQFDSRSWAISARGLSSLTANKLLVMIDGRSVYTPLFSGVFWEVQNYPLEDIDRIEVIRGPGAALWGANAVNGVINIVTAEAAATQGGLAVARTGSEQPVYGVLRWGGEIGRGHYRLYGQYDDRDGLVFADGRDANDDFNVAQTGFRADFETGPAGVLTLQGDAYEGEIGHPVRETTDVDGANLGARWRRDLGTAGDLEVRAYYDHTYRRVPAQFEETRQTYDLELQHHFRRGRHELVWGGGYRSSDDNVTSTEVIGWVPSEDTIWIANLFAQDEIELSPELRLTLGTKLEEQSYMDLEVQPSVRLAWQPRPGELLWGAVSRAVRAPTRIDLHVRVPGEPPFLAVGNPDFQPEEVIAYELGFKSVRRPELPFSIAAFYNVYDDLRSQEPSPGGGLPFVLGNRLEGETYGTELTARVDPAPGFRLRGSITWLETDLRFEPGSGDPTGGRSEANDPSFHGFLRADLDLPRNVILGAWLRYVDDLPAPAVPGYFELDLRLAWRPREAIELSLVGQNLLHDRHPEFGSPESREEIERGVYGEVVWRF